MSFNKILDFMIPNLTLYVKVYLILNNVLFSVWCDQYIKTLICVFFNKLVWKLSNPNHSLFYPK